MKAVFLDCDTLPHPIEKPKWITDWTDFPATPKTEQDVIRALQEAQICITNKVPITAGVVQSCPELKLICVAATGYDCIDLQVCREKNITVVNVPGYATDSVAESVIASIFILRRQLRRYDQIARTTWPKSNHFCVHDAPILDVAGATLGVFGHGAIGSQVATLARALGMNVLLAEHRGRPTVREGYTRFEEVIARSDVITLHSPLIPATVGMIGHAEISRMKTGALIVNTSRGGLIQEAALLDGLDTGHLGGAALDVLSTEPPPEDWALLQCKHPNLLITPHVAWASQNGLAALSKGITANLQAFHQGQPINVVC